MQNFSGSTLFSANGNDIINIRQGNIVYQFIRSCSLQKGGSAMREKVMTALTYLAKAAAVLAVVAEAGKKVMSLTED